MKSLLLVLLLVSEPAGFWNGPTNDPVPATIQGGKVIHTRELNELLKKDRQVVVVDVSDSPHRPENLPATTTWLPVPHPGIPGAIWIPGAGLGTPPADVEAFYKRRLAKAAGADLSRPLDVYCHQTCWLSSIGVFFAFVFGFWFVFWFLVG